MASVAVCPVAGARENGLHSQRIPQELRDLVRRDYPHAAVIPPLEPVPICHVNLARAIRPLPSEMQTALLIRELAALGLQQRLVIRRGAALDGWLDELPGLTVCKVDSRRSAVRACRKADLIHAHEARAEQAVWAAARGRGNYLITRRAAPPRAAGEPVSQVSWLTRRIYRNAGAVVAVSEATAEEARRCRGGTAAAPARIPDAWAPRQIKREEVREIRGRFGPGLLVGHMAAMDHEAAGQRVLLEAARRLEGTAPAVEFALLGGGPLEKSLRAQARGLAGVHFVGEVENSLSWMMAFDIFVPSLLREGWSSMLLGSLCVGAPVVADRTEETLQIVTEDCGLLVPPGDAAALADALAQLARNPELPERLSRGALERAKEFSPGKMAARYLAVYRQLGLVA